MYGKPGVETYVCHEEGRAIKQLLFSVNEVNIYNTRGGQGDKTTLVFCERGK